MLGRRRTGRTTGLPCPSRRRGRRGGASGRRPAAGLCALGPGCAPQYLGASSDSLSFPSLIRSLAHRRAGIGRRGIAGRLEGFPEEGDGGARRRNRSAVGGRSNKAFSGAKLSLGAVSVGGSSSWPGAKRHAMRSGRSGSSRKQVVIDADAGRSATGLDTEREAYISLLRSVSQERMDWEIRRDPRYISRSFPPRQGLGREFATHWARRGSRRPSNASG